MKISTFWYCIKEGMKNICKNIWFSLASVATISACIFLFCLFFSIIANIRYMVKHVESTVGITVLFDENLTEQEKEEENLNIKNGLNFARKVIQTEECDVLILDEILGLTDRGIVTIDELKKLIDQLGSGMELYLTGTSRCEELWPYVDEVTEMTTPYRRTPDSHFCEED